MILNFNKPEKILSKEQWEKISCESATGAFLSNMSNEDKMKWKAKHIKGDDERIEIRTEAFGPNLLIKVYDNIQDISWENDHDKWYKNHKNIKISTNGGLNMTFSNFQILNDAINEAREILKLTKNDKEKRIS